MVKITTRMKVVGAMGSSKEWRSEEQAQASTIPMILYYVAE